MGASLSEQHFFPWIAVAYFRFFTFSISDSLMVSLPLCLMMTSVPTIPFPSFQFYRGLRHCLVIEVSSFLTIKNFNSATLLGASRQLMLSNFCMMVSIFDTIEDDFCSCLSFSIVLHLLIMTS